MSRYKEYDKYKESGSGWINEVPIEWEIVKLKRIGDLITGLTPPGNDPEYFSQGGVPWIKPEDILEHGELVRTKRELSDKGKELSRVVEAPSVAISCIGTIGKSAFASYDICTNQQITSINKCGICTRFVSYLIQGARSEIDKASIGNVIKIINSSRLGDVLVPLPSHNECTTIATFLDRETSRIDRLIDAKKRFIERLKEKRQALISHAVTKGLDPNAPMKDSGVEWIGEIPEGWATTPIGSHYEIQLGKMIQSTSESENDIKIPYLKAPNVKWESVYTDGGPSFMWGKPGDIDKYSIGIGDLLICEGGDIGRSGFVSQISDRRIIQNSLHRVRSKRSSVKFLMYFMRHVHRSGWLDVLCNKSTIAHLTVIKLSTLKMPFPRKEEQDEIVSYLEVRLEEIDRLLEKTNKSISLLEEKRAAIVTAAVTGKIDVRDEA